MDAHARKLLTCAGALAFALQLAGCNDDDDETFRPPDEINSANGELRTTFTVSDTRVQVAGDTVLTTVYNDSYMPPLLRVRPGDTIFLNLINRSADPTNEHYHGLNVSPRINADATVSDNVLIRAEPGTQVNYKIAIPANHNPGLYWYHAHLHGIAEKQIMGGLSGGLIVEGVLDPFPELSGIRERVMLLKDIQITPDGTLPDDIDPGGDTHRTVNGQTEPRLRLDQGELQFWRIANIGADMYYRLTLEGVTFLELARDGNRRNRLLEQSEILLPPGSRSEVLVRGGTPGTRPLRTLAFNTGPVGDQYEEAVLAWVETRESSAAPGVLPASLPVVEDFRPLPVARRRTITFLDGPDNIFYMDSGAGPQVFDPNRVDSTIVSGTVEEWTINNASGELHVFHIHQTDFQVTEIDGVAQEFTGHQDNVNVPFQPDGGAPGQVKVIIDFRNPDIVGKFVYHCHILEHEDGGMMSIAEVVAAPGSVTLSDNRSSGPNASRTQRNVIANTLAAFQAGSFCEAQSPLRTSAITGSGRPLDAEPLQVRAQR